ncbi:hypothetical protein [Mycobacterium sp.]|uniref:Rv0361 family membrane protein n=1 Tax=Mycobacterium sp. TaxID=1785 RepID=UPI003A87819E
MPNAPEPDGGDTSSDGEDQGRPDSGADPTAVCPPASDETQTTSESSEREVAPEEPSTDLSAGPADNPDPDPADNPNPDPAEDPADGPNPEPAEDSAAESAEDSAAEPERRYTAPGFDVNETQLIPITDAAPAAPTQTLDTSPPAAAPDAPPAPPAPAAPAAPAQPARTATPQSIPPRRRMRAPLLSRNWGWVLTTILVALALVAIAIIGTILLTRGDNPKVSREEEVRQAIENFGNAVQRGDLTELRRITCGATRDSYLKFDEKSWAETYRQVSAAKQYPVIVTVDQVVVNGQHAEANVTTFMAYDPRLRSTRSLDLQFRDDQWEICQSTSN